MGVLDSPVADQDEQQDDQQYQTINGFRLPVPRTADMNAGRGVPMSGSPRLQAAIGDDLVAQAMAPRVVQQPMVRVEPSQPRAAVRTNPAHTTVHPAVLNAMTAPRVEGTQIPGVAPNGGDDAVKQAMLASSTRMPPAPPQDDSLSSLMQQREQAGQPLDRTNPRYRMSWKQRLLGTLANFGSGMAGKGPVEYVGPGAMNRSYYNDAADQQARTKNLDVAVANREKLNEENLKGFDSAVKQAYESRIADERANTAAARQKTADAQQQNADIRQQLADQRNRDITWDAGKKRFMLGGKIYVPKTIEEGASLEAANGVQGYYTKLWGQQRKNQPININNRSFSARDKLRLDAKAKELGKSIDDLTDDEINDALYPKRGGSGGSPTFKDKAAVDKYSDQWYRQERARVEQQKTLWRRVNPDSKPDDDDFKAAMDSIENQYQQRAADFEERKKGYYAQVGSKGGSTPTTTPAPGKTQTYNYNYVSKDGKTRIGSNDGVNWTDKSTGRPYVQR